MFVNCMARVSNTTGSYHVQSTKVIRDVCSAFGKLGRMNPILDVECMPHEIFGPDYID